MRMAINVAIKVVLAAIVVLAILQFTGCCTYGGKVVSKSNAARMRALGMDVRCPGDEMVPRNRPGGDVVHQGMVPEVCGGDPL